MAAEYLAPLADFVVTGECIAMAVRIYKSQEEDGIPLLPVSRAHIGVLFDRAPIGRGT